VEIVLTPQKTLVALLATYNQPAPAAAMPVAQVAADQKKKDKAQ
jgi:hypothetical protein